MKAILQKLVLSLGIVAMSGVVAFAQRDLQFWRPLDTRGLTVFETSKDDTVAFDGFKVRMGGAFALQYQNIQHYNEAIDDGSGNNILLGIGGGFNLATANLNLEAQLADGIRLELVTYLSSRHHQEAWVKGGYIQIDKLPMFKSELIDNLMKNITIKMGHMEINYGDAHFIRSDNGNAFFNPFVGNFIMDAFTTEIAGEVYYKHPVGMFAMIGLSNGEIKGDITTVPGPDNNRRTPAFYAKAGFDKQINDDIRVRLSGSLYTTKKSANNTLWSGDRAGSRYYLVMENQFASTASNFTSGRWNPGFRSANTSFVINPFFQVYGLEVLGTFDFSKGSAATESEDRKASQIGVQGLYRFMHDKLYAGIRYDNVTSELSVGNDVKISRMQIGAGWYVTPNLLMKGEYVNQTYKDFPMTNRYYEGQFKGFVLEAVVAF